jgi:hypothetical protein
MSGRVAVAYTPADFQVLFCFHARDCQRLMIGYNLNLTVGGTKEVYRISTVSLLCSLDRAVRDLNSDRASHDRIKNSKFWQRQKITHFVTLCNPDAFEVIQMLAA